MANPSLGDFEFIRFHRTDNPAAPPLIVREQLLTINRPGVDGTACLRTGQRSEPFQMVSGVDVLTRARLSVQYAQYANLIGRSAYTLVWQDVDFTTVYNTKYVVLDVVVIQSRYMPVQSGGLNASSTAWLDCLWTLQPVLAE